MFVTTSAQAHHAFATEFDVNRPVTLEGKIPGEVFEKLLAKE